MINTIYPSISRDIKDAVDRGEGKGTGGGGGEELYIKV